VAAGACGAGGAAKAGSATRKRNGIVRQRMAA